jgi:hypothetical protein
MGNVTLWQYREVMNYPTHGEVDGLTFQAALLRGLSL